MTDSSLDLVPAPHAPLGSADTTRRYALVSPDGTIRFPGITRPEGHAAAATLSNLPTERWDDALVSVVLPVLLSDGAGPHLLDARGRLVLAVATHPGGNGDHVAIAAVDPADVAGDATVGLIREVAGGVWLWRVRATVGGDRRIEALDDLDRLRNEDDLAAWQARWE